MNTMRAFAGEAIGTAILVFFGCGSVAVAVLFGVHQGLFQIAMVWGLGVMLAIYVARDLSGAHLNPAVSIALTLSGRAPMRDLPVYIAGQFLGAAVAALLLYGLLAGSIAHYEALHQIVRGTPASVRTAMMFGEFYPNPDVAPVAIVTAPMAFATEAIGTFVLMLVILALTEPNRQGQPGSALAPLFIGLTITALISVLAPLTQAGFNPARDLAPRLVAYAFGWGAAAMPDEGLGFLTVYVLGPVVGASVAALLPSTAKASEKVRKPPGTTEVHPVATSAR